jgi:SAM-dependent methyltransferase
MPAVLEFISRARATGARRLLDAGCGDGRHLVAMVRQGFPLVAGCDGSWRGLEKCRRRLSSEAPEGADGVILIQSPLEELLVRSAAFDALVCVDALVHNTFEACVQIVRELCRCVRPGGRVLFNLCTDQEPCRSLPSMEPITPSTAWYTAAPGGPRFYYEFHDETRARQLLEAAGIPARRAAIERCRWQDEAHEGFREYPHEHEGWFIEVRVEGR